LTVVDKNHLKASLAIDPGAQPVPVDITVVTGDEIVVGTGVFTVAPANKLIASVSPPDDSAGSPLPITITGNGTQFASTSKITFGKQGLSADVLTAPTPTTLTANLKIAPGTTPGPSNITVKTGNEIAGGTGTGGTGMFTVAGPIITGVFPASGRPGETLTVTFNVSKPFTVTPSTAVTFSNPGVVAVSNSIQQAGSSAFTATVNISADAGVTATAGLQKPPNTYAIYGSRLKDLKILFPPGIQIGSVNEDTLVTFSLTDDQVKATKGLVVQHGSDPPIYRPLPDPPSGAAPAASPPSVKPHDAVAIGTGSVDLAGTGMSKVVGVLYQGKALGFTSNADAALTLTFKLIDGTAVQLAPPGIDVVFVYADKTMQPYFLPVKKPLPQ
jgi:hypothetical protein